MIGYRYNNEPSYFTCFVINKDVIKEYFCPNASIFPNFGYV